MERGEAISIGGIAAILLGLGAIVVSTLGPEISQGTSEDRLRARLADQGVTAAAVVVAEEYSQQNIILNQQDGGEVASTTSGVEFRIVGHESVQAMLPTGGYSGLDVGDRVEVVFDPKDLEDDFAFVLLPEQVDLGMAQSEKVYADRYGVEFAEVREPPLWQTWGLIGLFLLYPAALLLFIICLGIFEASRMIWRWIRIVTLRLWHLAAIGARWFGQSAVSSARTLRRSLADAVRRLRRWMVSVARSLRERA